MITSSRQMKEKFGAAAFLRWRQKRFGEDDFTEINEQDSRLSDNGFILTVNPHDVDTKTIFECELDY